MYNDSKQNKDFLNREEENLMIHTTIEKLQETTHNSNVVSIQNLVKLIGINSCIPIIRWIKEKKIHTTEELDGTMEILEKPIVLLDSVLMFIEQRDESLLKAIKRKEELDEISWLDIEEDEIEG
ncbi:hypothetical protein V8T54_002654 [Bacillus paranthracis]